MKNYITASVVALGLVASVNAASTIAITNSDLILGFQSTASTSSLCMERRS